MPRELLEQLLESGRIEGQSTTDGDWLIDDAELRSFTGADIGETPGEKRFIFYLNANGIPFDYERP